MTAGPNLADVDLFRDLAPQVVTAIARQCSWKRYSAHQQILAHDDESNSVHFLVCGRAKAAYYAFSGREVIFRDIPAGEIFGEIACIDGLPRSASVFASSECLVASLGQTQFKALLSEHPEVGYALQRRLCRMIRSLTERVVEFSTLAVNNRIHAELLRLARDASADGRSAVLDPAPTHADIAARVATHREAVTREMGELRRRGILEKDGNRLVVPDIARLAVLVADVTG